MQEQSPIDAGRINSFLTPRISKGTYNSTYEAIHGITYNPFKYPPILEEALIHAVN